MCKAKVTSKGQVTIPKAVRDKLGIKPGDVIEIRETPTGYSLQKYVDSKKLEKYVGYLRKNDMTSTDEVIKNLRDK